MLVCAIPRPGRCVCIHVCVGVGGGEGRVADGTRPGQSLPISPTLKVQADPPPHHHPSTRTVAAYAPPPPFQYAMMPAQPMGATPQNAFYPYAMTQPAQSMGLPSQSVSIPYAMTLPAMGLSSQSISFPYMGAPNAGPPLRKLLGDGEYVCGRLGGMCMALIDGVATRY